MMNLEFLDSPSWLSYLSSGEQSEQYVGPSHAGYRLTSSVKSHPSPPANPMCQQPPPAANLVYQPPPPPANTVCQPTPPANITSQSIPPPSPMSESIAVTALSPPLFSTPPKLVPVEEIMKDYPGSDVATL